jgi:diguanylate cyclase (GGDEF)-like protein/PAS domain S-box-containing protein
VNDARAIARPLILLVDDQPSNLHVLAEALHGQYEVQVATTGEAALLLAVAAPQPALILLDVMMPGVDGYEVCRRLKANAQTRHIPVIFVTARTDAASEELGFELGAVDYITKPFNIPVLRARVRTHLTLQGLLDELEVVNQRLNQRLSELIHAHEELRHSRAQQELYARALECTADGILITDADGRILAVNPAFTRITGYPADEALGRNPRILKSGRHPDAFYRELWATLHQTGHWSGEIFNRRKDGEIYPELRTISAVRDPDGRVTHYVAVFSDISTVKQVQERLDHLTWHDPLTGLANRYLFSDHLQQTLSLCTRRKAWAAALLVDIDRFKLVNEARGLSVADRVLHAVAGRLGKQLDAADTLARLAADDFAVILPDLGSERDAAAMAAMAHAEGMRAAVAEPLSVSGSTLHLTASIGIALLPAHRDDTPDEVLRRAETARRRSALDGGNRALFFDDDMTHEVRRRFNLEQELYRAVERDQLALHLQPQVDDIGRPIGAEALLRWQHPRRGLVSPTEFIPLAEESDLICRIEAWTLANVGLLIARMPSTGLRRIALNISPRHFRSPDFIGEVLEAIAANRLAAGSLVLELTEATTKGDIDEIADKMHQLAKHGVSFAIDDFGVGYSSLSYLRRLPIEELKIDCSFMRNAPEDSDDAAIVDTILAVARQLRLRVVAEGVASQAHAMFLDQRAPVCRQGFFYGRPEPAAVWMHRIAALQGGGLHSGGLS